MSSVRKQDALVMAFAKNEAAQDIANGLGNLTKGRNAMEKATAGLAAHHVQAMWSRRSLSVSAPAPSRSTSFAKSISSPSRSSSLGMFAAAIASPVMSMPKLAPGIGYMRSARAPSPFVFGMAA